VCGWIVEEFSSILAYNEYCTIIVQKIQKLFQFAMKAQQKIQIDLFAGIIHAGRFYL